MVSTLHKDAARPGGELSKMPDLSDKILPLLRKHKLAELDLAADALYPSYEGFSILNVSASLCKWLKSPDLPHPPIKIPELDAMAEGVSNIVLVLIDSISASRFRTWLLEANPALNFAHDHQLLAPLTSVVPSTTSSALTSLWTGRSPAEHGILGYEIFIKEYGIVLNMITHSPMAIEGSSGLIYRAGFDPVSALPVNTLGPQLHSAGVETHAFLHHSICRSGLSKMHYQSVPIHAFGGIPDLWISVRELVERKRDQCALIWIYYGGVDAVSHRFAPDSERAKTEFVGFIEAMERLFTSRLSTDTRKNTLLLMLSDHGQIFTPRHYGYELRNHPLLVRDLHMNPTGEHRFAYLYPRPGKVKAVIEYFKRSWGDTFTLLPSMRALKAGLFGPGVPALQTLDRIGDLIAISQGDAYLWWNEKEDPLQGRHGGLSEDEMLVPLLALRL
jgi:hypothetical protein